MITNSKSCCANCGTLEEYYINSQCPSCGYIGDKLQRIELVGYEDELLFLEFTNYEDNNTTAIIIQSIEDDCLEPYIEITTNIENIEKVLTENEILVKTWSENESFVKPLLQSGFFSDTGKRVKVSSFCEASIWKIIK